MLKNFLSVDGIFIKIRIKAGSFNFLILNLNIENLRQIHLFFLAHKIEYNNYKIQF